MTLYILTGFTIIGNNNAFLAIPVFYCLNKLKHKRGRSNQESKIKSINQWGINGRGVPLISRRVPHGI